MQQDYANYPAKPRRLRPEDKIYIEDPVPDYTQTPPRSRSGSPIHHVYENRKMHQKTRFSTPPASPTLTTVPRSIQTQTLPKKKTVSNSITNSLRRLVGKIRSVSAERKLKMKTKPERSPSPSTKSYLHGVVIDGHIRGEQGDQGRFIMKCILK